MQHLQHFGLSQDPFRNEPDLRFFFESAPHREAEMRVGRALRQSKGLSILTGEGGTGKTLLARRILESLEDELFEATLLIMMPGASDATSILRRFATQLEVQDPSTDRAQLVAQVYEQLAVVREDGRHAVLILDDAHVLDREAMAEVGGLANLEYEDRRLLSLLLVGLPQLDKLMAADPSLGQRIDVRVRLSGLNSDNTAAYLAHRLSVAGGRPDIIPGDAIEALVTLGRGRPRLLNTLSDNALFEAFLKGRSAMAAADVERAASDLGIGRDPGTTYTGLPGAAVASPPDHLSDTSSFRHPTPDDAAVRGEFTDPDAGPMLEAPTLLAGLDPSASDSAMDLGDLLEAGPGQAEFTTVLNTGSGSTGTLDLDDEVEAALGSADPGMAEATQLAFAEEGPPKTEDDEIDDLFVELIDD